MSADEKRTWIISAALALCVIVVYWPVRHNDFIVADDYIYIVSNPFVTHGLNPRTIAWAFTTTSASNWHPLTWLSHALDCELWGTNPAAHHLTSVILHALSTALLFLVFCRMTGSTWRSVFVAAIFGLHPLHVESVAWAAERKDVLSGLFFMLTLLLYTNYARQPTRKRYGAVVVMFALGLMSKPMLVSLPIVLLLLDYWPLRRLALRDELRKRVIEKIPLFVLAVASCVITYIAQSRSAVASRSVYPIPQRIENALISYVRYIGKAFCPTHLAFLYPAQREQNLLIAIACGIGLLLITLVVVLTARKRPYLLVGWLWFVIMLVPVIGIVQVGMQSMADRYMYLPLIGLTLMIAWAVPDFVGWRRGVTVLASIVLVTACAVLTYREIGYWKNGIVLFERSLQFTPDNAFQRAFLGAEFGTRNELDAALAQFRRGIELNPVYTQNYVGAARVFLSQHRNGDAAQILAEAARHAPPSAVSYALLASLERQKKNYDGAIDYYQRSLALDPNQPETQVNLATALMHMNNLPGAADHMRRAIRLNPWEASWHRELAGLLSRLGHADAADRELDQADELDRQHAQ